jgi:Spy/CpxP family protein refolding chaperone
MKIRRKPNFVDSAVAGFSNRKGMTMRIFTASAIAAALALGTPTFVQAQAQGTSPQSEAQTPPAQSNKLIQSVQIVNVKDLKPEVRSKVDDVVARTSDEDMQSLRRSIDATPEAASALKAQGLSSSQVVAINVAGGVLTLFARTA